jgi:ribosomal protein S18 acetylase RimI-like enzyme
MLLIREFVDSDAPPVLGLARSLQAHEAPLFERMKPPEDIGPWYLDALLRECREKAGALLVAQEDDGPIIAYATVLIDTSSSIAEMDHRYARVGDLVVSAHVRGRGIARALIAECERRAFAAGVDELRLEVLAANQQARAAYASLGFEDLQVIVRKKVLAHLL